MHWIATAGALALLTPAMAKDVPDQPRQTSAQASASDDSSPPPILIETITMETERYRRMTVPVTIMGEGPFEFMVDTGSQATVLSRRLAEQLELTDREPATLVGMASSRAVETTLVPRFQLGERTLTLRTVPILEGAHIGGADGILGLDSLQDHRVLLNFADGILQIFDSVGPGGRGGYDIVVRAQQRLGQLIIHRAHIDGVSVDVILDTGAQGSVGNLALRERLRRREQLDDAVITDINGVRTSGETRMARRLEMGTAQISNVVISFTDAPTFHSLGLVERPALILGMRELRLFKRVAIDFRSRRVLFDLPGDVPLDQIWHFNRRASRLND